MIAQIDTKPVLDTNIQGLNTALDSDLALLEGQVRALKNRTSKRSFTSLAPLFVAVNATAQTLCTQLPNDSYLEMDMYAGQHINIVPDINGNLQSGLIQVHAGSDVNKRVLRYQNDNGVWLRTFGGLSTTPTDSGWVMLSNMKTYNPGDIIGLANVDATGAKQGTGLRVNSTSKAATGSFNISFTLPATASQALASWTIFATARGNSGVSAFVGSMSISSGILFSTVWTAQGNTIVDPTFLFVQLVYNGGAV